MRRLSRWFRSRSHREAAILLYHRVAELDVDPWGLAVSPSHFEEHLGVLAKRTTVLPLLELIGRVMDGTVPRRAVAVTFDDGYADNLLAAKPLLERDETPAIVFVTTGPLVERRGFWWDELEALLLPDPPLPATLEIVIEGVVHRWQIDDAALLAAGPSLEQARWRAWMPPPTRRHAVFVELWYRLLTLQEPARRVVLDALWISAGRSSGVRTSHRTISTLELPELARGGLIAIGAHTETHSRLSALPEAKQRHELVVSRQSLENLLGVPVTTMSYPFGGPADYTPTTVSLAREVGFDCACAAGSGALRRTPDLFQLPRCFVPDVGADRFEEMLDKWLGRAWAA